MTNSDERSTISSDSSVFSTTTEELFRIWATRVDEESAEDALREDLRREAQSFFRSMSTRTTFKVGDQKVLSTKPSHEGSLALLIQQLEPAFTSERHAERLCALSALNGSLEGCSKATLSTKVVKLLGNFLLSHCGPLRIQEGDVEGSDEQVRDIAIEGLSLLVRSKSSDSADDLVETIKTRLMLARKGVENRCAHPELDAPMEFDHGMDHVNGPLFSQSGLSALSRSKRSLCFNLLQSCVKSVGILAQRHAALITNESRDFLESELVSFASFVSNCLHGESDPRCLMQLIQLCYALMESFYTFFNAWQSSNFPIAEIFDSVSAYYPIQFTPPPNDVHGITRQGLVDALFSVLCFFKYDHLARSAQKDTMLMLSLSITLERFEANLQSPTQQDNTALASLMAERLEAVKDLEQFLFGQKIGTTEGSNRNNCSKCVDLSTTALRQISDALMALHEEASIIVARRAGVAETSVSKETADHVRMLVSKIALDCEQASSKKILWRTFVADSAQSLAAKMESSPSQGRVAIAYMATLAASGGPNTLRHCLKTGLGPLLSKLSSGMQDDDVATAAYGVGAFFSASQTAMDQSRSVGITIDPHPLEPYCAKAIESLCLLWKDGGETQNKTQLQISAVRALETVILSSPINQLSEQHYDMICSFVTAIVDKVNKTVDIEKEPADLLVACSTTVGHILGIILERSRRIESDSSAGGSESITNDNRFCTFIKNDVFETILISVRDPSMRNSSPRYDWKALAIACAATSTSALCIVGLLADYLRNFLELKQFNEALPCAAVLSFLFAQRDKLAIRAFHDQASPYAKPITILEALVASFTDSVPDTGRGVVRESLKNLLYLPPSPDDQKRLSLTLSRSRKFVAMLRPAFLMEVEASFSESLIEMVTSALPPLSEADLIRLSIMMPFLSALLESNKLEIESIDKMKNALSDLADFVLDPQFDSLSRSHAALCLHGGILSITSDDGVCPSQTLVARCIAPNFKRATGDKRKMELHSLVINALRLMAVLGSAAACRGRISAATADKIANFFVDISCIKKATLFVDDKNTIDFVNLPHNLGRDMSLEAATFLGSMISAVNSFPIQKQRLMHVIVKRLQYHLETSNIANGKLSLTPGMMAAACHVVCSCKRNTFDDRSLQILTTITVPALGHDVLSVDEEPLKKMFISAILKLAMISPDTMSQYLTQVIIGVLRTYAVAGQPGSSHHFALKLLCLQALQSLAPLSNAQDALTKLKPAIVSLLAGAMNHPSAILRQAAVEVRNSWYIAGVL